jgi:hypothetical protein
MFTNSYTILNIKSIIIYHQSHKLGGWYEDPQKPWEDKSEEKQCEKIWAVSVKILTWKTRGGGGLWSGSRWVNRILDTVGRQRIQAGPIWHRISGGTIKVGLDGSTG